jgi:hypothetical protein
MFRYRNAFVKRARSTYAHVVADELELGRVRRAVRAGVLDELEA